MVRGSFTDPTYLNHLIVNGRHQEPCDTTVPKVLIERGNMRNATDAALLVEPSFQRRAARSFAEAITEFLTGRR